MRILSFKFWVQHISPHHIHLVVCMPHESQRIIATVKNLFYPFCFRLSCSLATNMVLVFVKNMPAFTKDVAICCIFLSLLLVCRDMTSHTSLFILATIKPSQLPGRGQFSSFTVFSYSSSCIPFLNKSVTLFAKYSSMSLPQTSVGLNFFAKLANLLDFSLSSDSKLHLRDGPPRQNCQFLRCQNNHHCRTRNCNFQ